MDPSDEEGNLREGFLVVESTNWYSYVGNNPLKYHDPTGLQSADAAYSWLENFEDAPDFQEPSTGRVTSEAGVRPPVQDSDSPRRSLSIHGGWDYAPSEQGGPPESYVASADGTVLAEGYRRDTGGYLVLGHEERYQTHYYHQDIETVFEVGDSIDQGQKIGVMGNSGISSGPHLDFRIRKDGVYLDPKVFFDRSSVMYGSGGQR